MRPKRYDDERGAIFAENPKRAVLCTIVSGYATAGCVNVLMQSFEDVALETPGERLEVFHDWEQVRGYAPGMLERYTEWSKSHRDQVSKVHVLIASRMVVMAIAVARLALPYLVGYSSRHEFEQARSLRLGSTPTLGSRVKLAKK